ncbi:MAG: aminotransferase class I/II-fold pyridoxal phosphate-dependent enzyme, partial [Flavobacteriales bacterium]|nr:aminotransferase class I/II-fold pyridoxal phosphate-dependent enzyme [Flavobacteriales bacterium]
MAIPLQSRLPEVGTTIFTVMSALANAHEAVNLSQGFPDFDCSSRLKELVTHHMKAGHNQYAPMPGVPALREQLVRKFEQQHGHAYDSEKEVTVTAGATQAIFTAILALVHPGDEVIIIEPAYDCYAPAIHMAGGKVIRVPLDIRGRDMDTSLIAAALTEQTRLIIINSPHNPTGVCFSESSMQSLERLLADTDVMVLSDEVYEHIVFDDKVHYGLAKYPGLRERGVVVSSFGKTYHNTGWKLGYCFAPEDLMTEFRKVHQFNVFSVNRPMQHAFSDLLAEERSYDDLSAFYQEKRDFFCRAVAGSRFDFTASEGTYFQLLDYGSIAQEPDV